MIEAIVYAIGFIALIVGIAVIVTSGNSGGSSEERQDARRYASLFIIIGIVFLILPSFFVVVDAGYVGVQKTLGKVDTKTLSPGLALKNPLTEVIQMSTRTVKYIDYGKSDVATITALSNDGLETSMGIAVTYHINPAKAAELYIQVGEGYQDIVMVNPIHSVPRDMISKYDTKTLYSASQEGSTDRAMLEQELYTQVSERINANGVRDSIVVEQVSIRNIDFVQTYKDSIASKMKMDTEIQQKKLEVERQKMEAERVAAQAEGEANKARIDAKGEADAARIRAQGTKDAMALVGDQYAKILFIQTMKDNPRAIYIPIGNDGLPIIKTVDTATV
jgi:regulator of protease activity HflC (stomatin/prohibitin superfamily)